MNGMRSTRSVVALAALAVVLANGSGAPAPEASEGPAQVVEGAKKVGRGVEDTAKGIGSTLTEGAKEAGQKAKPVADTLHDRAKDFGEAIWGGMKHLGRTLENFFTGSKK